MDIKTYLEDHYSVESASEVALAVADNPSYLPIVLSVMAGKDHRTLQQSSWALGKLGDLNPQAAGDYLQELINLLETSSHPAVLRNIYRLMQNMNIEEEYHGRIFDLCCREIENPKRAVAIRVFAMTTAFNISKSYPELLNELKCIIENNGQGATPAYASRSRKIINEIKRLGS